jgi:hypothetical protein
MRGIMMDVNSLVLSCLLCINLSHDQLRLWYGRVKSVFVEQSKGDAAKFTLGDEIIPKTSDFQLPCDYISKAMDIINMNKGRPRYKLHVI